MLIPLTVILLALTPPAAEAGPFDGGAARGTLLLTSGQAFGNSYSVLGLGVGYYLVNGLELGLDVETWMGGEPSISVVSPALRYVFSNRTNISPYLGVFYRKTYIEKLDDLSASGYRLGAFFTGGSNVYLGAGMVMVNYHDCETSVYASCSDTYPEVTLGVAF